MLAGLLVTVACGSLPRQMAQVRSGLLTSGLHQEAFVKEWGLPYRTLSQSADQVVSEGSWVILGGRTFTGTRIYDSWEYRDRGVTLLFYGHRLVAWQTDKTVEELRTKD